MRAIITVLGRDRVGIIARVCVLLSESGVNILDISQTIVQGFFNMLMIVDLSAATAPVQALSNSLDALAEEIGVQIRLQREEIFSSMHRV